ncbi:plasmid replication initiation protein [Lachnospiraceae bacterium PF1-22]
MDVEKNREFLVVKKNELIQKTRFSLTLTENRIVYYLISQIKPDDTEFKECRFSIRDFCRLCGINSRSGGNYELVKESLLSLKGRTFEIETDNKWQPVGWIGNAYIEKNTGMVGVTLDPQLVPYLTGLSRDYTQLQLAPILVMKSHYSSRLYELLYSYLYKNLMIKEFDLESLRERLGCNHYTRFNDFKKRVLEVAEKEINLYSAINISWEPYKEGRAVKGIKFTIRKKNKEEEFNAYRFTNETLDSDQIPGQQSLEFSNDDIIDAPDSSRIYIGEDESSEEKNPYEEEFVVEEG